MIGFLREDQKRDVDVVVVSRETLPKYTPWFLEYMLKRLYSRVTLIWDFDDDIFTGEISHREASLLKKYSDYILVTGEYLKGLLPKEKREKVIVLPTTDGSFCHIDKGGLIEKKATILEKRIRLVWIGTASSLWNLEAIVGELDYFAKMMRKNNRKVILTVVCNRKLEAVCSFLEVRNIPWSRQKAERAVLGSHIGIMPLGNSQYNLGKGGFKLIQYMAAGIPVAASAVGYNYTVIQSEYGRLVDKKKGGWYRALSELCQSEEVWKAHAYAAHKAWWQRYDYRKNLHVWEELFAAQKQVSEPLEIRYTIIIVNWNAGMQLKECVDSIAASEYSNQKKQYCIDKLIIVDNASEDHSADFDMKSYPFECEVIYNEKNTGFAHACNQGSRAARRMDRADKRNKETEKKEQDYFVFLNPDTRVYSDTFEKLSDYLCKKPSHVGIVGVQLEDEEGRITKTCSHFPNKLRRLCKILGITRIIPATDVVMAGWDHKRSKTVDQVMGAFFVISEELFASLHGFDERFFMYYEEVDLCRRARNMGYCAYYYAGAKVYHKGGGTSEQVLDKRLFYILESYLKYEKKHHGMVGFILGNMLVGAEYFSRRALLLAGGKKEQIKSLNMAYRELLRGKRL